MGVFAVIGLLILLAGAAKHDGRIALLGIILIGVGIAGDSNGY